MFGHLTDVLAAWGPIGILALSILDSSGVPVAGVFDALLILVTVKRPDSAWLCASAAVVGSTAGNLLLFWLARQGGRQFMAKAAPEGKAKKFRGWFADYGLITVFVPALIPIPMPMKLFVISAGVMGTSAGSFTAVVLSARTLRYFGEAWLGMKLGENSAGFLKAHVAHFCLGAALLFLVLWLLAWMRARRAAAKRACRSAPD